MAPRKDDSEKRTIPICFRVTREIGSKLEHDAENVNTSADLFARNIVLDYYKKPYARLGVNENIAEYIENRRLDISTLDNLLNTPEGYKLLKRIITEILKEKFDQE